ncbi:MAG: tetratricopeptide repeat protein [Victivallales bacterium]|jgi:tetratricopeptide (TPR) repeat protein
MERKAFKDIPADLKGKFQSALGAKDIVYAMMLLKGIVQKEPCFGEARDHLRKLEKSKVGNIGFFARFMSALKTYSTLTAGRAQLARKKPMEALKHAEDMLAVNLKSLSALRLMAEAGRDLNASFITIEALEIAREYFPRNIPVLDWLADEYAANKQGTNALRIRQEISAMKPDDLAAQQKVRAAAAQATMDTHGWNKTDKGDEGYRTLLKSQDDAVKLEQQDRIVRNIDDVKNHIGDLEKQIAEGKGNQEMKRKLADLYQKAEQHDKAIEYYNMVAQEIGAMDPFIDRAIEKSTVAKYEQAVREWQKYAEAAPDKKAEAEKNIEIIESQMNSYKLDRSIERVNNYPNDLQLRYELAVIYFELGDFENALGQFQLSQKNPQRRLSSIVYLGQCFHKKKQHDIAIEEYTKAISEMLTMDRQKMDALYFLGLSYEETGNIEKAVECFKQIYRANVKFRDVSDRMDRLAGKA